MKILAIVPYSYSHLFEMLNKKYPDTALAGLNYLPNYYYEIEWITLEKLNKIKEIIKKSNKETIIICHRNTGLFNSYITKVIKKNKVMILDYTIFDKNLFLYEFIKEQILNFANVITFNTKLQIKIACQKYFLSPKKIYYHPWGIDINFYHVKKEDNENDLILTVGHVNRDFLTLVKATKSFKNKVIIAAENLSFRSKTAEKIIDLKTLQKLGYKVQSFNINELLKIYQKSSIVVLPLIPSISGAGVSALLEAFAMKKACIVTDTPGLKDYIKNFYNAIIVESNNPKKMQNAIEMLINNKKLRKKISENARKTVENKFNTKKCGENLNKIILNVI